MLKKNLIIFGALLILFLILRISILLFSPDKIFIHGDELFIGALAKELIQKPMLPIFDYFFVDAEIYEGGKLLASLSAAPFFMIFGDSYFSLKLTAVFFSALTIISWLIFLLKFFNFRAALFFVVLFVFAPPFYIIASLVMRGAHAEYNFLTPLFFIFLYKIIFKDGLKNTKNKMWAFFGIFSGLSFWVIQSNALVLAVCFLIFLISDIKFLFRRAFRVYILSFIIGYSPGIYHTITRHWQFIRTGDSVLNFYSTQNILHWPLKSAKLILNSFPESFAFNHIFISYFYYFVFAASFLYFLWSSRKLQMSPGRISKELPLLLYFIAFIFVYTICKFSIGDGYGGYDRYRYLALIYPVIFIMISLFLNRIYETPKKTAAVFLLCILSFFGLYANMRIISFKDFGILFKEKGYSYRELGFTVQWDRNRQGITSLLKHLRWINPRYGDEFIMGLCSETFFEAGGKIKDTIAEFNGIPSQYRGYFYKAWGESLYEHFFDDPESGLKSLERFNEVSLGIGNQYKGDFYAGLGKGSIINASCADDTRKILDLLKNRIDTEYLRDFYAGMGEGLREVNVESYNTLIRDYIDEEYLPFILSRLNNKEK